MKTFSKNDLQHFLPNFETFVGIDSDGCVFDTMEIKQKDFFHPAIIRQWHLEKIEPQVRAVAEFTYLYSVYRGLNRFWDFAKFLSCSTNGRMQQIELPCPTLRICVLFATRDYHSTTKPSSKKPNEPEVNYLLKFIIGALP